MGSECLSPDDLMRYMASAATDRDIAPLERHIDHCEACRRSVVGVVRANRDQARAAPDNGELAIGTAVGRYEIRAVRGIGAMGSVFEASDPDLDRTIAIKIVHHTDAANDARALREGRALARLVHPNVVAVYDVGIWSGGVFLAMELVRGTTVREWAATRRSWREVVRVFAAAARGLHAAHRAELVHRDVKPENLIVAADGRIRIIDFGLATVPDNPIDSAEQRIDVAGTPAYMAPEQRTGSRGDARSDQYAFMVTLFETLEGRRPERELRFERKTPSWLRAAIKRGLRGHPEDRHIDMAGVARAFDRGLGVRRRRAIAAVCVAFVGAATAAAWSRTPATTTACDGSVARLAGTWDVPRKATIRDAMLATGTPYAGDAWRGVERVVDRYASSWTAAHVETCEATRVRGEQSTELLELRMACLDDRLLGMRSLGDALIAGGPDVAHGAVAAAVALEPLDGCANAVALTAVARPPAAPEARARIDRARGPLREAYAALGLGHSARAAELLAATSAQGFAPFDAERLLAIGRSRRTAGDFDGAAVAFRDAAREADAGGADAVRIDALIDLIDTVGVRRRQYQEALVLAESADALVERIGSPARHRARVLVARGSILAASGSLNDAASWFRTAVGVLDAGDDDPLATASALIALGGVQAPRDAAASYERAAEILEAALGATHPDSIAARGELTRLRREPDPRCSSGSACPPRSR